MFSLGLVKDLDTTPKAQSIEEKYNGLYQIWKCLLIETNC